MITTVGTHWGDAGWFTSGQLAAPEEERREGEPKLLLEAINQFQTVGRGRSGTCCTAWPGLAWPGSTPPQGTG